MREQSTGNTVLVVDGGGRGHALVDAYAKSYDVQRILAVPGNDMMQHGVEKPVSIYPELKMTSVQQILEICKNEHVDLVDVAQDNAVEVGLVNELMRKGIPVLGPTKEAGQIEWDKGWARKFGARTNPEIPQPRFHSAFSMEDGVEYFLKELGGEKAFIKYPYLAAGKGALAAYGTDGVRSRIKELYDTYGDRVDSYLVEEWLEGDDGTPGEEFSTFVLSDGATYKILGHAQDHKTVFDGDQGENTGGMGCSSPPLVMTEELLRDEESYIIQPAIKRLAQEKRTYKGILYAGGIALRREGKLKPYLVEYNARWGDPEAQVIVPSIQNDFFALSMATIEGKLKDIEVIQDGKARVVVAGASAGYPEDYKAVMGREIKGLKEAAEVDGVRLYGAGVKVVDGKFYAAGGRLFYVVGEGEDVVKARERAYEAMGKVSIDGNGLHYRHDIGWRDVARLQQGR